MQFPHCDPNVLHAPGECKYCDHRPVWQWGRIADGINFTGHHDPDKATCPAEQRRPVDTINQWGGNVPTPEGHTTIWYNPQLVTDEEADVFYQSFLADASRYGRKSKWQRWLTRVGWRLRKVAKSIGPH